MLAAVREVVPLDDSDIDAFKKQLKQNRRFDSVPLKLHLTEDEIARFAINRWRFPGLDVVPYLTRRYPYGPLFAHVVGYVEPHRRRRLDPARCRSLQGHQPCRAQWPGAFLRGRVARPTRLRAGRSERRQPRAARAGNPCAHARQESVSQHRRARAEGGHRCVPGAAGLGRGDRSAQRPGAGHGQRAELRSEPVRQRHQQGRLHRLHECRRQAVAQSRAEECVSAGFDGEAVPGVGWFGAGYSSS